MKAGETYLSRPSRGRDDGYDVGSTIHATRINGGGGPDGHYWTITWAGKGKGKGGPGDGQYEDEWMVFGHARPATEAECAPIVARARAEEERKAWLTELEGLVRTVDNYVKDEEYRGVPAESRWHYLHRNMAGHRGFALAPDGTVWFSESSYDDTPRGWKTTNPRAVELLTLLLG